MSFLHSYAQFFKVFERKSSFGADFSPCSVKQSSCLTDSDIPGIRDLIDEERGWLDDEEFNSSCDKETDDQTNVTKSVVEDNNNVKNTGDEKTYATATLKLDSLRNTNTKTKTKTLIL